MTDGISRARRGSLKPLFDFDTFDEYKAYMKEHGFVCPECDEIYSKRQFYGNTCYCSNGHSWENKNMFWSADG